jgi:hypothetical protein
MSHVGRVRVDQRVSAVRAVEVPVLVSLRNSCNHVTGRRSVWIVRLALKVVIQNDRDFVDVILLYIYLCVCVFIYIGPTHHS